MQPINLYILALKGVIAALLIVGVWLNGFNNGVDSQRLACQKERELAVKRALDKFVLNESKSAEIGKGSRAKLDFIVVETKIEVDYELNVIRQTYEALPIESYSCTAPDVVRNTIKASRDRAFAAAGD